jgi:GST-like protein
MSDLSAFPITERWPAKHPDRLSSIRYRCQRRQGLDHAGRNRAPYEVHLVDFNKDDQKTPEFLSLNPNGKIPPFSIRTGRGKPLGLFESGAICSTAEKTGKPLPG